MKWLVTIDGEDELAEVAEQLRDRGYDIDVNYAVPGRHGQVTVPVDGPDDLPSLATNLPSVKAVHSDSEITLM